MIACASVSKQTQFLGWTQDASTRMQDACRVAAGTVDAKHPQGGRKTPAVWTQNSRRRSVKLFLGSTVVINFQVLKIVSV